MVHFLSFRFSAIFLLSAALLLSGCCANDVCDCRDTQQDAVRLRFSSAFSESELDTVIVRRYPLPYRPATSTKYDSVTLVLPAGQVRDSAYILLNNNAPFAQSGTNKLSRYRYVVKLRVQQPAGVSKPPQTVFVLDSVVLRGGLDGTGCCSCYTNSQKTAVFSRKEAIAQDSSIDLKQMPYILKILK